MKTVAFLTLGCKVNHYETEAMQELFEDNNYTIGDFDQYADIYIINTCTVTNLSDRKSRQAISKARRQNKDAVIAVVGCYSQIKDEEVANIEGVNIVLGTENRSSIVNLCEKAMNENVNLNAVTKLDHNKIFDPLKISQQKEMTRAYIKIQEGCSQFCSYCIIPYARGPIRSRNMEEIFEEAKLLAKNGYKEIVLTGIHVASYGRDYSDGTLLIDVIEKVAEIPEVQRIRLSSVEPRIITEDFLERGKKTGKLCDHFHLSLQSGSDKILKDMNRKYDKKMYEERVNLLREYFPHAGITTDIIVGFPGETDSDFTETLNFAEAMKFSRIHVFKYSQREGTAASKWGDPVNGTIKKDRSTKLIALGDQLSQEFMTRERNRTQTVLVEESHDEKYMYGYSSNYLRIKMNLEKQFINQIVKVNPIEIIEGELFAEIIK